MMDTQQQRNDWRTLRVARKAYADLERNVALFDLVAADSQPLAPYAPGQYLTLRLLLPDPGASGRQESRIRCYTLVDPPGAPHYRIAVKRQISPPGVVSSHLHDAVDVGTRLEALPPAGGFVPDDGDLPLVLIAGGIGITPILSMLQANFSAPRPRKSWLFYGVRHGGELVYADYLYRLARERHDFHRIFCFSRPWPEERAGLEYDRLGHVTSDLLRRTLPAPDGCRFYLCGPQAMMASLLPALLEWGVARERIHCEAFGPASWTGLLSETEPEAGKRQSVGAQPLVTFSASGRSLPWDPDAPSLLEFAEAQDIAIDSGCRSGLCGACQTRILSGRVDYPAPPDFQPAPGACLPCVAKPAGDLTLEA
ncbi:MAG: 2Fe-2S iron-sulfur cluster binding domain-containing protein [Magnetococcales bacterium]|nr:2Fe-2S iron-sulfur cluster binding domain-containing protein [Magnetococcales bacterium]